MRTRFGFAALAGALMVVVPVYVTSGSDVRAASPLRTVSLSGTAYPATGEFTPSGSADATAVEFVGETDDDEATGESYDGTITDRSLARGTTPVGVDAPNGKKAKSTARLNASFEGLNLYQQRYARGGNQFTVEPPDQALCVGNGYVVEAVNDV